MVLSIKKELSGSVLLTGGIGFLGSVCLEQMLSLTEVKAVYLVVRRKKGMTAQQRVQKFLCGPLFTELHQQAASGGPNLFNKVRVLEGDIELPELGLSAADKEEVLSQVDMVIHSAAVLTLDAHIQDALRANFCGTQKLLQLARQMRRLRSFVYVSTFYVNNFKPYNTTVPEEVHYPTLQLAGDPKELTYTDLTDLLLHMPGEAADKEVYKIMRRLNFTSTYAFSKLLTEQLVDDPAVLPGVAKAIVRPSLIASMAGAPFPGYISGYAGAPGYSLAYGMGFFHDISGVAFASDAIVDIIPVDTTSALTIAAAAAAAAHGPYTGGHARVYHAASAASYPQRAPSFFDMLRKFWIANPAPFSLPFARFPAFTGRHSPTLKSIRAGTLITHAKVWLAARLLELTGHKRKAHTLVNGFKAFCVQNDPRYARSVVSCVHNTRKLQRSLAPEEQGSWQCVWEEAAGASWDTYGATALAGLRTTALKLPPSSIKGHVPHNFTPKQPLSDPSLMALWMAATSSSSSSSAAAAAAAASTSPLPADSLTHISSNGSLSRSSSVADSVDTSSSIDSSSSSSLSSGYVAVGTAGAEGVEGEGGEGCVHSRRGWPELLSASEAVRMHVKRTKSCHAVLVNAAY